MDGGAIPQQDDSPREFQGFGPQPTSGSQAVENTAGEFCGLTTPSLLSRGIRGTSKTRSIFRLPTTRIACRRGKIVGVIWIHPSTRTRSLQPLYGTPCFRLGSKPMQRPTNIDLNAQLGKGRRLDGECQIACVAVRRVCNLNMIRFVPRHHLIARYAVQHRVHHRPLPVGQSPSTLTLLCRELDGSCPSYIGLKSVVLDEDPAPDHLARLRDPLNRRASKRK